MIQNQRVDVLVSGGERIISQRISKVLQNWSVSDTVNKSLFLCLFVITGKLTRLRLLRRLWSRWYYLPSAPSLCLKLGNILDVFPVLSPSVCAHWPVKCCCSSVVLFLLALPRPPRSLLPASRCVPLGVRLDRCLTGIGGQHSETRLH